ncbi:hypothetical protein F5I97DRAFT_1922590 [Phlebopus sp. FC_14]|nr:hypothetical protein F5I97DRAFT_1922590 [Phlebopus sp. FC_14]
MSTSLPSSSPGTGGSIPASALPFNVDNTLGALLVGGLFAAAFWGVTSAQTFIYYRRSGNDRLSLKLFVASLWVLDTFDACLTSHILYHYLVTNFFNPLAVAVPVWSVLIHVSVTSITDVLIRSMFAWRVWRMSSRNVILTGIVTATSFLDLVVALAITVKAFQLESFAELDTISTWLYIEFAAIFAGDLLVAVILCYYLFKSRTGLRSIDAILGTIFYIIMPHNFIFIGFYLNLAKLYINSYLALLNARDSIRERADGAVSIHLSDLSEQPFGTNSSRAGESQIASTTVDSKKSGDHLAINMDTAMDRKTSSEFHAY